MTTYNHLWSPMGSVVTLMTTGLDALANTAAALSDEIDNATAKAKYLNLELYVYTQEGARTAGGYVQINILPSVDGTNYNDATAPIPQMLCVMPFDAAVTARYAVRVNLPIPPCKFKLQVVNRTGQAFGADNSTLKYTLHSEQTTEAA